MALELELKLCGSPADLRDLQRTDLLQGIALTPAKRQNLHSTYYDSATLEVTRAGGALRLRKQGRRWLQTLKLRGSGGAGLSAREEIELPAKPGELELPALQAALGESRGALLPQQVEALFTTRFARTALEVRLPGGGRAELAFDTGTIEAGEHSEAISELEIELIEGAPWEVFALGRQLLELADLRVENRSKAERGFALLAPVSPAPRHAAAVDVSADDSARLSCARLLGEALAQLEGNEAGLLLGEEPEFIHQARVAIRRLRSLLRLFAPLLPDAATDAFKGELRAVAQVLGRCRDLDVFCAGVLVQLQAGMAAAPAAVPLRPLLHAAEVARASARAEARDEVASHAYTELKLGLGELISRLADRNPDDAPATSLSEFAGARLKAAAKRLERTRAGLAEIPADAGSAAERVAATHALRLQVKKLRYACDALAPVFAGRRARRYQRRLQGLQALLGDFNDAATAQTLAAGLDPGGAACACVQGFAAARMLDLMARLPGALQRFERARTFW